MKKELLKHLVVIRGGGDISTGIAVTLWRVGYHVLLLEQARPTSLRREASFADCVYIGQQRIVLLCRLPLCGQLRRGKGAAEESGYSYAG